MNTLQKAALAVWNFVRFAEPVAATHAFAALLAVLASAKAGHLDYGLVAAAWLALQAVTVRKVVTPTPSSPPA